MAKSKMYRFFNALAEGFMCTPGMLYEHARYLMKDTTNITDDSELECNAAWLGGLLFVLLLIWL